MSSRPANNTAHTNIHMFQRWQINKTPNERLIHAIGVENLAAVTQALQDGATPNIVDNDGYTPLSSAALDDLEEIVQVLLIAGADPNLGDPTPLQWAVQATHIPIATLLLTYGADVNKKDQTFAETPLESAKQLQKLKDDPALREMVDLLENYARKKPPKSATKT